MVKDDKKEMYQDCVTAPLNREHNNNAGGDTEGPEDNITAESLGEVLTAIPKVCFRFIHHQLVLMCFSSKASFGLCIQVLSDGRHG